MNEKEILSHCTIVKIVSSDTGIWYEGLIGKELVAFGFNEEEDQVYVCYKDSDKDSTTLYPIYVDDVEFVQGYLDELYEMD